MRSFEQKIQVQSIRPESTIKFVASSKNTLVASTNNVFKLEPSPYDRQVQSCIQNKQFELALSIAVSSCLHACVCMYVCACVCMHVCVRVCSRECTLECKTSLC